MGDRADTQVSRQQNSSSALTWGISLAIFLLLALAGYLVMRQGKPLAPAIVILGDSVYGEYRAEDSIAGQLQLRLGMQVFNGAIGGTRMARMDQERRMDDNEDCLSMAALAKSVVSGDFGVQQRIHSTSSATEYLDQVIDELEKVSFGDVGILLLGYGMNDYQNGIPLENPENPRDEYTFAGALRMVLEQITDRYPDLRVILLTPTYSWYPAYGAACEEKDWGGGALEEYVALEDMVAAEYGVEVIDLYHGLYTHEKWEDWSIYTKDGVHPTDLGRELIARTIAEYLEENP